MKIIFKIVLLFFLIILPPSLAQNKSDALKRQALLLMREGRYGEAVDQLNKYISANPREADGYHQRGLCYEQRIQYQYSVLDLRRALRLEPANVEIRNDLDRVIAVWHRQLYQKIEGHKRDIAVDPNYPFTYLEIGKSYRWLEEWKNAENWYDEYLKRDNNASPDEIIRYTEILAKTGSITKGEKILKNYTERYPNDWRIWSRYGYFTLWLGKNKTAEEAFKTSLGFKPFFKEAEDGLDLSRREGYVTLYPGRAFERAPEYPIDRYYRIINQNPDNDEVRFNLIDELLKVKRYEEAYQQLQMLSPKHQEGERYKSLWKFISDYRDSVFNNNVNLYTGILKENPSDKEAVIKLAESYANLFYYDSAVEVLNEYLQDVPEDKDLDARFKYVQYSAWNYEWEKAIAQLNKLLELDPDNLDYQLLRGQIGVWTVNDLPIAEKYLLNVLDHRPKDLSALLVLTNLYLWKKEFSEAKKYLDKANLIAPNNPEVESAESNYALHLSAYEEMKVFEIRSEAGKLAMEGKCSEALQKYEEYKSKRTGLTREEMIEYASIASCAKNFDKAIENYDKILADKFDYSLALQRAK
ncbi:MAG: tetratricopeptide repeat protein, partial [Bacteroidota bacterium]